MLSAFRGIAQEEQDAAEPLVSVRHNRSKRLFDIVFAGAALLFLSPALLLIALALLIVDGRPLIYRHTRIGHGGRQFRCLKFRSMRKDGDKRLAELFAREPEREQEWLAVRKLNNDPRVHTLGKFLRMTSADELPQLINVLRGEMSIVGPRPIVHEELERYGPHVHYYLSMTPGVTGLWQVERRCNTSYEQRVQFDVDYYHTRSFSTDMHILWKTVGVVLLARNEKHLTK
ncbi:sugar transferase [Rhizobium tubonense]|uniref:Sugar transferase n=1 Tax=Rhizobium tubonense TaxID=484088 RepID=A0A2W4CZS3_9HYPH|nr:sugar transferase [Rhizobium tubonense]PZM16238.1 sugar transferase [Rhizobium tubonense]